MFFFCCVFGAKIFAKQCKCTLPNKSLTSRAAKPCLSPLFEGRCQLRPQQCIASCAQCTGNITCYECISSHFFINQSCILGCATSSFQSCSQAQVLLSGCCATIQSDILNSCWGSSQIQRIVVESRSPIPLNCASNNHSFINFKAENAVKALQIFQNCGLYSEIAINSSITSDFSVSFLFSNVSETQIMKLNISAKISASNCQMLFQNADKIIVQDFLIEAIISAKSQVQLIKGSNSANLDNIIIQFQVNGDSFSLVDSFVGEVRNAKVDVIMDVKQALGIIRNITNSTLNNLTSKVNGSAAEHFCGVSTYNNGKVVILSSKIVSISTIAPSIQSSALFHQLINCEIKVTSCCITALFHSSSTFYHFISSQWEGSITIVNTKYLTSVFDKTQCAAVPGIATNFITINGVLLLNDQCVSFDP